MNAVDTIDSIVILNRYNFNKEALMTSRSWNALVFAVAAACSTPVDRGNAVERELRELDRQWAELAVHGDPAAFDRLVTDDHIATHASGKLVSNAEEKTYLATSPQHIAAIATDDVGVRVYGDTAIVLGRVTVKMRSGKQGQYRYTTVWLRRGDRWKIVTEQHTKIEPPAAASSETAATTPEQVVRAYTKAANDFDLPAFVALHGPDVKKFARVDDAGKPGSDKQPGEFAMTTSGRDEVERKYQRLFANTPRTVHVDIVGVFALGDLVVSRDRVSGFTDGHVAEELTMYEVRDGLIRTIWYLDQVKH
jgi:ketosteroid isomerase-like protein